VVIEEEAEESHLKEELGDYLVVNEQRMEEATQLFKI
jgi:hypothetical protein